MERLKEFKRRQQQAGSGSCVSCNVNFTTILKRRVSILYTVTTHRATVVNTEYYFLEFYYIVLFIS